MLCFRSNFVWFFKKWWRFGFRNRRQQPVRRQLQQVIYTATGLSHSRTRCTNSCTPLKIENWSCLSSQGGRFSDPYCKYDMLYVIRAYIISNARYSRRTLCIYRTSSIHATELSRNVLSYLSKAPPFASAFIVGIPSTLEVPGTFW